jgi:hypothetical protein
VPPLRGIREDRQGHDRSQDRGHGSPHHLQLRQEEQGVCGENSRRHFTRVQSLLATRLRESLLVLMRPRQYPHPVRLAPKLLAIRLKLGLSQSQMVRRLNFKGDYGRISEYERGTREPNLIELLAYGRVSGILIEDLVDDEIELKF